MCLQECVYKLNIYFLQIIDRLNFYIILENMHSLKGDNKHLNINY